MKQHTLQIPELLAPAGSFEKLVTAIHYGADAVYLGGRRYSLRAHATNFSEDELEKAVAYAHGRRVKVYVTVNIFAHDRDLTDLPDYLRLLRDFGVDGLIVSDPGILSIAKETVADIPLHLSTQANVTNGAAARFWHSRGVSRMNMARELSLAELQSIRRATSAEIEVFVHGALCISYSGRCLLSLYLTGRDANQGDCAHPCRYLYRLEEEKRPGQFFPVEEDARGTYIFNAKDLCLLPRLPDLIRVGVDSIKIEGRMKSVSYVGIVVRAYRAALDYLKENRAAAGGMENLPPDWASPFMEELVRIGSRGYTENFVDGPPEASEMLYQGARVKQESVPVGIVVEAGPEPLVEARNRILPGDRLDYLGRGLDLVSFTVTTIRDREGGELPQANPGNLVRLATSPPAAGWEAQALLRKISGR